MVGGFERFGESYTSDYSILRINTDGTKDTSFNNQSKFAVGSDIKITRQTPDGYILTVSTNPVTYEGTSSRVHLIDSNGDRINSSNVYDSYQLPAGIWSGLTDIVWDTNVGSTHSGKFYVGFFGTGVTAGGHTVSNIARYNSDWTIDKTFNTYQSSAQSGFDSQVNAIKILSDGNILAVGSFTQYKGVSLTSRYICKLDKDGNRISGFDTGGVGPPTGPTNYIRCVEEDSSGNIYIGGGWTTFNGTANTSVARLVKLNPNGGRNVSFSNIYTTGTVLQIIADPNDGNIFVLNASPTTTTKGIAKLLSSTGALSGSWVSGYDLNNGAAKAVFASASNSLYLFGQFSSYIDNVYNGMLKLNGTTGIANGTFSTDARFVGSVAYTPKDSFIDSNGKIVLVGLFRQFKSRNFASVKLSPSGSVDNTFNSYPSPSELPTGVLPDGKGNYFIYPVGHFFGWEKTFYVSGGSADYNALPNNGYPSGVIKLTSTGSFDNSYVPRISSQSGVVSTAEMDYTRYQLYVGGNFTRTTNSSVALGSLIPKIMRVSATSGVIDSNFNTTYNGTSPGFRLSAASEGRAGNPTVASIKYDPVDNKVYCGGDFVLYNGLTASRIIRLTSTGSYDQTFQVYDSSTQSGFNSSVSTIDIDRTGGANDGKIYFGGSFTTYKGVTQSRISRLNSDGTLDTSFSTGTGFTSLVSKIIVIPDGKIFTLSGLSYNGSVISYVCRLNSDGTLDTTFDTGIGFQFQGLSDTVTSYVGTPTIRNIKYDPSGKLYVMGNFGKYRGEIKNCIVRLNMDGTIDSTFNDGGYGAQQVSNGGIYDISLS
jgi:uncharacterized delta-60 repeat protein